jgi:hypothetical protein
MTADFAAPFLFGYKMAEICLRGEQLWLRSGTAGVALAAEGEARCYQHPEHIPPVVGCRCGFFAKRRAEALVLYARYPYSQLLEVELSGRIRTTREDLRGQHQRLLRILVLPHCVRCGAEATLLGISDQVDPRAELFGEPALSSLCESCTSPRWWLPEEVAEELSVPVSWAVPQEALVLHGVGMQLGDH